MPHVSTTTGSPPEDASHNERRYVVYKQCISALQKNEMNNKMAAELVGLLMLEVVLNTNSPDNKMMICFLLYCFHVSPSVHYIWFP